MTGIWYLLRTFWKPLALLALAAMIYGSGYQTANDKCEASSLKAENAELARQLNSQKRILDAARKDGANRQAELNQLKKEAESYETVFRKSDSCTLTADDIKRLRWGK